VGLRLLIGKQRKILVMKLAENFSLKKSPSFGRGVFLGLTSPKFLFSPIVIKRDPRFDGSVEEAWSTVGRVLRDAFDVEGGKEIQKANAKKYTRTKKY